VATHSLDIPREILRDTNFIVPANNFPASYFLEQAGLATPKAYDFALGQYGFNMIGVFGAWFLMSLGFGRRLVNFLLLFCLALTSVLGRFISMDSVASAPCSLSSDSSALFQRPIETKHPSPLVACCWSGLCAIN